MVEQDEPISALGAANLPLTGNEKIVLVQNGVTKQTDIDNLPQPGGQLNANELAAIQNANLPTGLNPFATLNDLSGSNFPTAIEFNTYEKGASDVVAVMPWYIVQSGAPSANDDNTKGFRVGSIWQDSITGISYKLINDLANNDSWQAQSGSYDPIASTVISNASGVCFGFSGDRVFVSANIDLSTSAYASNEGFLLPIYSNILISDVNAVVTFDDGIGFQFIKAVAVEFSVSLPSKVYVQFSVPTNAGKAFIFLTYPII
jgi:hypothetical protein